MECNIQNYRKPDLDKQSGDNPPHKAQEYNTEHTVTYSLLDVMNPGSESFFIHLVYILITITTIFEGFEFFYLKNNSQLLVFTSFVLRKFPLFILETASFIMLAFVLSLFARFKNFAGRSAVVLLGYGVSTISICLKEESAICRFFLSVFCLVYLMKIHSFIKNHDKDNQNTTVRTIFKYMLMPTFVYKDDFCQLKMRPKKPIVVYRLTFIGVMLASVLLQIDKYIYPVVFSSEKLEVDKSTAIGKYTKLWFSVNYVIVMMFFLVFEGVLNLLADLTSYKDRNYYGLFWNISNYYELYTVWNSNVSHFMRLFIYEPTTSQLIQLAKEQNVSVKISTCKKASYAITIAVSSIIHEIVLQLTIRTFAFPLFGILQSTTVLMILFHNQIWPKTRSAGNICVWMGFFLGMPYIFMFYTNQLQKSLNLCN